MPSLQKTLLGGYVGSPHTVSIPKSSRDNKTIVNNGMNMLYLFQDSSQAHSEYLGQVLPQLFVKNWTTEKYVKWFRDLPQGAFLEVDTGKKLCYLCSVSP